MLAEILVFDNPYRLTYSTLLVRCSRQRGLVQDSAQPCGLAFIMMERICLWHLRITCGGFKATSRYDSLDVLQENKAEENYEKALKLRKSARSNKLPSFFVCRIKLNRFVAF